MKIIRGFLNFIISLILIVLIVSFTIITSLLNVIQNQIIGEFFKQIIIEELFTENTSNYEIASNLAFTQDVNIIINSILADYINYSKNNTDGVSDNTVDLIVNFCIDHKQDLEKIENTELDINELQSLNMHNNLKHILNDFFISLNDDPSFHISDIAKVYGTINSNSFKIEFLVTILIFILLLALINWSPYKWMKPFGIVLIISGILVSILYGLISIIRNMMIQELNLNVNIKLIIILAIVEFVSGIVLVIIHSNIRKKLNNTKDSSPILEVDNNTNENK